jgi:hypothetical protein
MEPIFNPRGPDMQATEDVIKALSTVLDECYNYPETKTYVNTMIQALVKGYRMQSGKKYTGFLPHSEKL